MQLSVLVLAIDGYAGSQVLLYSQIQLHDFPEKSLRIIRKKLNYEQAINKMTGIRHIPGIGKTKPQGEE
jgi:hypothetical protein